MSRGKHMHIGWQDKARIAEWLKVNYSALQGTLRAHRTARLLEELDVNLTVNTLKGIERSCGLVFKERKPRGTRAPRKSRAFEGRVAALEKAVRQIQQALGLAPPQQPLDLQ